MRQQIERSLIYQVFVLSIFFAIVMTSHHQHCPAVYTVSTENIGPLINLFAEAKGIFDND